MSKSRDMANSAATINTIVVGDPAKFIIDDLDSSNVMITENVTNAPADWTGDRYTFDGTTWAQNPDWVEPE